MQQVCETTSQTFTLMAAVDTRVGGKPRPLSPEPITLNFESRTTDNLKLKGLLETTLTRAFFKWPVSSGDLFMLTLAALSYHPQSNAAIANYMNTDSK